MQAIRDRPGSHWYAVQTKTRAEDKAVTFLRGRDVSVFLPRLLVHRRHGSRRWQALEPLFPGYLFAQFAPEPRFLDRVRWTPGVKQVLGVDDQPVAVPDEVVDYLRGRVGTRGYIIPAAAFALGMRVRFRSGSFAHLEGVIERPASRADRVRVLLQLLNTTIAVDVDVTELERV